MSDRGLSLYILERETEFTPICFSLNGKDIRKFEYLTKNEYAETIISAIEGIMKGKKVYDRVIVPVENEKIKEVVFLFSRENDNSNKVTVRSYHPFAMRLNFFELLEEIVIAKTSIAEKELVLS